MKPHVFLFLPPNSNCGVPSHSMGQEASSPIIPGRLVSLDHGSAIPIGDQKGQKKVRIVCISDTHGYHAELKLPDADILVHTGDITNFYNTEEEMTDFNNWLATQPYKYKVVISGNHDYCLVPGRKKRSKQILSNATHYLEDSGATIEGIKFWGSPWHIHRGSIFRWANNFGVTDEEIRKQWNLIPSDTDILLTHFPPLGILTAAEIGCPTLTNIVIEKIKPMVHIFGHNHDFHGAVRLERESSPVTFVNAANHVFGPKLWPHIVLDVYPKETNS